MKQKIDIGKMLKKVQGTHSVKDVVKPNGKIEQIKKPYTERDMRQEAIDLGAHGAKDFFMGGTA